MSKKEGLKTVHDLYELNQNIRKTKHAILKEILKGKKLSKKNINSLRNFLQKIESTKKVKNEFILRFDSQKVKFKLGYAIEELKKDLIFLEKGEKFLLDYFEKKKKSFWSEVGIAKRYLEKREINFLITDRDGTINNYSENYFSSVQPIYNAFFVHAFSKKLNKTIILSSVSLKDLLKVNILEQKNLLLGGSKGREFISTDKKKFSMKIPKSQKSKLDSLKKDLEKLIQKKEYEKFKFIGSGFQEKHGELTIARQDILGSVSKTDSSNFFKEVNSIIANYNPNKKYFSVNDTGLDIEIILKSGSLNFGKDSGLKFILNKSRIRPSNVLVCGDTKSDLDLIKELKKSDKNLSCVFVTTKNSLKREVKKIYKDSVFVSDPDILITALYLVCKGGKNGV